MFLHILDNKVKLATHQIVATINPEDENLMSQLSYYQIESFGVVAYSSQEKDAIESILISHQLPYSTEVIAYENEQLEKVQTKKYGSRSEALADIDIPLLTLDEYKQIKNDKLSEICNAEILDTFVSSAMGIEHVYSFDYEAQMNMAGNSTLFDKQIVTNIDWNTKDAGVLSHNKTQFEQLFVDGTVHKMTKINKYRAKKDIVNLCVSKNEVDTISWND